ncbi:hypothetical protein M404DRAFT_32590 [Pisolithus tinctorius Marx 270]|uniref:Uncharacterized protein n=1 Tax=Pisolithus tinctorius Marx 270 TaxID=870435 RepID=A0A0C3JHP6_PISTI|nr:hypothetical protein M404DRAFT_32590 [Pisolithus tinctorius Marx 270]
MRAELAQGGSALAEPNALSSNLRPLTSGPDSDLSLQNFPSYPSAHSQPAPTPP